MPVERVQVAKASEAPKSGSMKAFTFAGEGDDAVQVLVSNIGGKLHATSAKCTHYGAPLANGVLTGEGKLICPWHGACFDAKTGDIEDSPALDSLMSFKLDTDQDGNIFVEADAEKLKGKPGVHVTCNKSAQNSKAKGTVIIGGGSAAINCAESARKVSHKMQRMVMFGS
jgi:nitrite reductase/ring-hydroxylating ferredoxin subunit